jgi:hypothetical protein
MVAGCRVGVVEFEIYSSFNSRSLLTADLKTVKLSIR